MKNIILFTVSFIVMHNSVTCQKNSIIPAPANVFAMSSLSPWDSTFVENWYVDDTHTPNPTLSPEAYQIQISLSSVHVEYGSLAKHLAYTTLKQLCTFNGGRLPQVSISDQPAFPYRGMHLDVGRHFFSVADIKKYIDYLGFYKFNTFHWHLTEDQGWRIEIKKYPKLQEIAAYRDETLVGHYSSQPQQYDAKRYGGYYTQDEVREIVAYASEKNIQVIPEIEMPGHSLAALTAYPELGCNGGPYKTATKWGVFDEVYCPTEKTFEFLQNVIDEVIPLFPSPYIHLGGDECPKESWKNSQFCQDLIKQEQLVDEHGLQSYFIKRMEKYINSKGEIIIGWDEILEGGLAPNATVMSWRGEQGGIEAAKQKHNVVMTPGSHCYFDYYQATHSDEPLAIGGLTTVPKVYSWHPIPATLDSMYHPYILGGQGNVWTEYIPTMDKVEYMALARMAALSEVLWYGKPLQRNYSEFEPRLSDHIQHWQKKKVNIADHLLDIDPIVLNDETLGSHLKFDKSDNVVATNGGRQIKTDSIFILTETNLYTFQKTKGEKKGRVTAIQFEGHIGNQAKIVLGNEPSKKYSGSGVRSLINGVKGSDSKFGGHEWLGFEGDNADINMSWDAPKTIQQVQFRFFNSPGQWIYPPKQISVMHKAQKLCTGEPSITTNQKIFTFTCQLDRPLTLDQLAVSIENHGIIASGNQGAGHPAWLFVDEIILK